MKKTVLAFLAREHGLSGLTELIESNRYEPTCVITHRLLPLSEAPQKLQRPDFIDYQRLTAKHEIPLYAIDTKQEQEVIEEALSEIPFDLIASISWRRLIPMKIIQRAALGGVNLHRGRLPDYPGAEPIKQALNHGDKSIAISAHVLTEEYDAGKVLCQVEHPVSLSERLSQTANIDRIKRQITPYFGPLLIQALDIVMSDEFK